jgi:hypothetical protein
MEFRRFSSNPGSSSGGIAEYMSIFDDYDTTAAKGATLHGIHFHVDRFYDGLIYDQAAPVTKETDGFCLSRTNREGKILYTSSVRTIFLTSRHT